ncbi:Glutathione transferase [Sergentomyia squamirostris]
MANIVDLLSFDNIVFRNLCLWIGILIVKMLFMSGLTAFFRIKNKAFSSPEDLMFGGKKAKAPKYDDPSVERVRRAHRNDLENVLPFIIASFFYTLTNPTPFLAVNLVRVGALCRIAHTAVYAFGPVPQPTRAIAFGIPLAISVYMSVQVILHFA